MKRVLSVIGLVLVVACTIGIVLFVLLRTGVFEKEDFDRLSVHTFEGEDGRIYTEAEWDWKPIESKKIISYVEVPKGVAKTTIALAFDNDTYYNVTIPDVPYVYDFGKTVWAEDGSFMIRVVGQATVNTLSQLAGIDNGENINQYTLKTPDGLKGSRTIATIVDGTAVVVNVYSGDQTYSIIRDSIANNRDVYTIEEIPYANGCRYLDKVSYTGMFMPSVEVDDKSLSQSRFMFDGSTLWAQTLLEKYDTACHVYLSKMVAASKSGKVEEFYDDGVKMFAKSGDYYVGVVKVNTNTSVTMIGRGEEAFCNIVSIMSEY